MLMVVFGAGASYDSVSPHSFGFEMTPDSPDRPPLAAHLFEPRGTFGAAIELYPRTKAIAHRLRSVGDGLNVEEELGIFQQQGERGYRDREIQLAAVRFYIRRVIAHCARRWQDTARGVTNYVALIDHLRYWQSLMGEELLFVTFNYDTLLEDAWTGETGTPIDQVEHYIQQPGAKIIKVHGSTNWVRQVTPPHPVRDENDLIEATAQLAISKRIIFRSGSTLIGAGGEYFLPAIAIPIRHKTTFECPQTHLDALTEALPSVTRLLVIGWAGADRHFLELCYENGLRPKRTRVACGPGNKNALSALVSAGFNRNIDPIPGGFSDLMGARIQDLEAFLTPVGS